MEEARAVNRIETNLSQEKIDFINAAYAGKVDYWKRAALGSKNEEMKRKGNNYKSGAVKGILARKDAGKSSAKNIHKMSFYVKKKYSTQNEKQTRIDNIPQNDRFFSFEEMSNYLKTYSKSVIEFENIKKVLFGVWLSTAAKVFRRDKMRGKNLPKRFQGWILKESGTKNKQFIIIKICTT